MVKKDYKQSKEHREKTISNSKNTQFKKGHKLNVGRKLSIEHKENIGKAYEGNHYPKLSKAKKEQYKDPTNHPNWQGGITPLNKLLRSKSMIKIWREAVFLRDNFTCQNLDCKFCGNKIGVYLQAHHIKSISLYPELRFDVSNGITYCAEFHIKSGMHRGIPRGENAKICE